MSVRVPGFGNKDMRELSNISMSLFWFRTFSHVAVLFFAVAAALLDCAAAATRTAPPTEIDAEYVETKRALAEAKHWDTARLAREAATPEALPQVGEWPSALVLRRTRALAADLDQAGIDVTAEQRRLTALAATAPATEEEDRARFNEIAALRRALAFKNPLLNFDKIVFLKHNRMVRGERHMCDQYLGFNQAKGGGVFVLENPFGPAPQARPFLKAPVKNGRLAGKTLGNEGSFVGLSLDFDASRIAFAYTEAEWGMPKPTDDWTNQPAGDYALSRKQQKNAHHYYWKPESAFHVFTAAADGTNVRQLTDGKWNDAHPTFLPNGRIVFTSDRRCTQTRCSARSLPCMTLHAMMSDGSDQVPISFHDTSEWFPSVGNDGKLVYTRWDYIDRDSDAAHHIWVSQPDGRNPLALHGNYPVRRELRPWMEMSIRAIPGSPRYMAIAAPHHGQSYGSVVLIDPTVPDDGAMSQLKRLTPEYAFPEAEALPGRPLACGTVNRDARRTSEFEAFGTPFPLSEKYFLAVHSRRTWSTPKRGDKPPVSSEPYGIYLCDVFGNRELLYRDEKLGCLDPVPFVPRQRPPALPNDSKQMAADRDPGEAKPATGEIAIMDIRETERPWPANTNIRSIRVVTVYPKSNYMEDVPRIGIGKQSLVRGVLGTAPVEADGSAYFTVPAGAEIYFQALDENGLAVQTMRSGTYVHPGERMTCIGCHEQRQSAPQPRRAGGAPKALMRPPSTLQAEVGPGSAGGSPLKCGTGNPACDFTNQGNTDKIVCATITGGMPASETTFPPRGQDVHVPGLNPLNFPALVQPVLDKHCVACHEKKAAEFGKNAKLVVKSVPGLRGDVFGAYGWSQAYHTLTAGHAKSGSLAWAMCGGNGSQIAHKEPSFSMPGQVGARASRLYALLKSGHGTKRMTAEELRRITLWLDCNSIYYSSYDVAK